MLLSIVTPCFNSLSTLRETIESVKGQDFTDWEHLVVDGGSTDGTVDLLKSFPHLKWTSEKDQGHFHAMNKGIARAAGQVVVILNADDCFRPGVLRLVPPPFAPAPTRDTLYARRAFLANPGLKTSPMDNAS